MSDLRIRILHVIPSLDPAEGGPSVAVPLLARAVAARGHRVVILTTARGQRSDIRRRTSGIGDSRSEIGNPPEATTGANEAFAQDFSLSAFPNFSVSVVRRNTQFYKISWELVRWLRANISSFDLVHIHALFSFASTAAAFIAAKNDVPYIVRPLGVLNRWGLENRRAILKRASLSLIECRILSRAAAIHYTTEAERSEASKIGSWVAELPSFVSPLPVGEAESRELATASSSVGEQGANLNLTSETREQAGATEAARAEQFLVRFPQAKGKRIVLFLSRIDPKKGIELLLSAFATVRKHFNDVGLVIVGSGDRRYQASLREKAEELGISADTIWTGFLSGENKAAALAAAEIFVLPSHSENFGIAAAEAFAAGKACILSDQVGLAQDARRANAAVVTRCDACELAEAIKRLLTDSAQQQALGDAARQFAKHYLSPEAVGRQLGEEYRAAASGELTAR